MGDFFKKEPEKKVKKEEELYTDVEDLFQAYDMVSSQIKQTTSQGYEVMLPIAQELYGGGEDINDIGEVGKMFRMLKLSRISKIREGQMMFSILKKSENLKDWSERYAEYLEQHITDLQLVGRSSFKIIDNLNTEIDALNSKIDQQEQQMKVREEQEGVKEEPVPERVFPDLTPEEKEKLWKQYLPRYNEYLEVRKKGGKHWLAKGNILVLSAKNPKKKEILLGWFEEMEKERSTESTAKKENPPKKIDSKDPIYSPLTQSNGSEKPLLQSQPPKRGTDDEETRHSDTGTK